MNSNDLRKKNPQAFPNIIRYLMIAIFVWGTFHTIGVYVWSQTPDIRKPIIVYSTVCLFLGFWAIMLWMRNRKLSDGSSLNSSANEDSNSDKSENQEV